MSDILSRLEAQGQGFSNVAQRGQEMVQGFDNDRLTAQGQTLAYNMGKAQLSTLIGAERVAGLQHGVPVAYTAGKAIAQRLQGMPTTKAEAVERAQQAARSAVGQARSTAQSAVGQAQSTAESAVGEAQSTARGSLNMFGNDTGLQGVPDSQTAPRIESTAKPFEADITETGLSDRAAAIPPEALEAMAKSKGALSDTSELDLQPSQVTTLDAPRLTEPAPVSRYNIDTRAPELKYNLPSPRRPIDFSEQIGEPTAESDAAATATGLKPVDDLFQAPPTTSSWTGPIPTPAVPVDAQGRELQPQKDSQQDTPRYTRRSFKNTRR